MLIFLLLFSDHFTTVWSRPLNDLDLFVARDRHMLAISDNGIIALLDSEGSRLLFLDGSGTSLGGAGKRGEGPGEFQLPVAVAWSTRKQAFTVFDYRLQRLSRFDEKGRFLHDLKPPEFSRNPVIHDDELLFTKREDRGGQRYRILKRFHMSGNETEELYRHPMAGGAILEWTPILTYAAGDDFVVVNHGDEPVLHIIHADSAVERFSIQSQVARLPLSDAYYQEKIATLSTNPKFVSAGITIEKVAYWPYLHNLLIDARGRIWLFLHREDPTRKRPYAVYDRKGAFIGAGSLQGTPQILDEQYLYVIREDEEGALFLEKKAVSIRD